MRFIELEKLDGTTVYVRTDFIIGVSANENLITEIDLAANLEGSIACYTVANTVEEVMNLIRGVV